MVMLQNIANTILYQEPGEAGRSRKKPEEAGRGREKAGENATTFWRAIGWLGGCGAIAL